MAHIFLMLDYAVHDWSLAFRSDTLTSYFKFITLFGSWQIIVPVAVCLSVFLYYKHLLSFIPTFWFTLISAEATTFMLKLLVARPRPFDALVPEDDFSFPSGHATIAVAFYGFVAFILIQRTKTPWIKNVSVCLVIAVAFIIGLSRLYLGVHYISDVVAGYVVGTGGIPGPSGIVILTVPEVNVPVND